ncbi:MAG: hypothetical protein AAGF86_02290 [Pseudomonadota bacterium]
MSKVDFIHIGLGKCMSTRLQDHWDLDPGYNSLSAREISNAIDHVIKGCFPRTPSFENDFSRIRINPPPVQPGVINVLTAEDLTFSYLQNPELGVAMETKDETASRLLAPMTDKVLILVRNPTDWIRSCYAQHVKEGGCVPLQKFLITYRDVVLGNLNLTRRVALWSRFGAEVVILPIELAQRDDAAFWAAYEKRLGVSRPSNCSERLDAVRANVTSYGSVHAQRRLNEAVMQLESILAVSDLAQKGEMVTLMANARKHCFRRGFSMANDEQLSEIFETLNLASDERELGEVLLDADCLEAIETSFMAALREDAHFAEYGCLEGYAQSQDAMGEPPALAAAS